MPDSTTLTLFFIAALALVLVPGPNVLYTVARSVHQGRQAGLISALSIGLGNLVHVAAAVIGLSALLASSALAFSTVKYAGAIYLIYLGVRTLLSKSKHVVEKTPEPMKHRHIFYQGFLVSVLNPKTALFFLAFLPQFVHSEAGAATGQILILGSLAATLGVCTDSLYVVLAGAVRLWLQKSTRVLRVQRYLTGSVYIALGVTAAFADTGRK